jgi:adenylate cyclase
MTCPGCGFEAQSDFAFCPGCGRKLPTACPACGFACASEFVFCPKCGAPLAAPAAAPPPRTAAEQPVPTPAPAADRDADRRTVTVLFADLTGFTALSERLDPEDMRAFQNDLFRMMAEEIQRFDGFVEKFVGDAVMAVFGAPVAHEDDPERALRAGLALLDRMRALSRQWEPRLGEPVTLHIGINTGPVVAGSLGTPAGGAYAVTGDTVNTAARLLAAAPPGTILASESTYRMAQQRFAFEPLGDLALKGKSDAVGAYRVLGVLTGPRPTRGLEVLGLVAPLIGRDDEVGQLLAVFERMARGRAQVVSLVGEAGAGKSRLLAEFFGRLEADGRLAGVTVRRAACSSLGEQPYGVFATFLRDAYGISTSDTLEAARRKLVEGLQAIGASGAEAEGVAPLVGYVLGLESGERVPEIEPEQLHRQIVSAARIVFERRLAQGPLVLVVEDLQWADAASVELLRQIVDRLDDRPLMLLVSLRPQSGDRTLALTRAAHTIIRMALLSETEIEALLAGLFGASSSVMPAGLRARIVTRAGGNPLYVEEVVRALIADGVLARDGDRWTCRADGTSVEVPVTLQALLLSRLDRLPSDERRLIQEASVLGPVFDESLLRTVAADPLGIEARLDRLLDTGLLREIRRDAAGRRHRFEHALVQEVLYQNLLVSRRVELHGRAGTGLERASGGAPERLEDLEALGHHFSLSADRARGARYLAAAGDWARAIYANDDAVRHYERALTTLAECRGCERDILVVRERLGDLLGPMGRRADALAHYEGARASWAAAADHPAQARLLRKVAALRWDAGERDAAQACLDAALELLDGPEHIERAHVCQEIGRLAFRNGDNERAIEWAQRALAQAERVTAAAGADAEEAREGATAIAQACTTLGVALARTGHLEEAVRHTERSVEVAERHGLLRAACRGYTNLGVLYSTLDPGRGIETCQRGLETAMKIGDLGFQSRLYANLAVAFCALTNRCESEGVVAAQAAIDLDRRLGQVDHLAIPLIVLGQIYQCHGGNPARALECYREAQTLAEAAGEPQLLFPCYDGLATLYLEMGDEVQAERFMQKAQAVCERTGVSPDSLVILPFLD